MQLARILIGGLAHGDKNVTKSRRRGQVSAMPGQRRVRHEEQWSGREHENLQY